MNLLLDTHTFLWFVGGDERLSKTARTLIEDPSNLVFLSQASLWEMAIKISLGKLSLSQPFETLINEQLEENQIQLLGITLQHAAGLISLPFFHRDPFDRMLIVQAQAEKLTLVSQDSPMGSYGVEIAW
jgi:PIN domain nuclease of toxin-antitoxin system